MAFAQPDRPRAHLPEPVPSPAVVTALRRGGCVFAEEEALLLTEAADSERELDVLVARRIAGEPLEHLLGWVQFCDMRIAVTPGVFVPRRRTEFLTGCAARSAPANPVVVDVCCGCGAVATVLAATLDGAEVYATDIDPVAVRCARLNLPPDRVFEGDLFEALPDSLRGRVDVLVANAPYVPSAAIGSMPREARCSEPRVALDGGEDGLDIHRRLAAEADRWLGPGGHLLIETAASQAPVAEKMLAHAGFRARTRFSDESDATVVVGDRR
ncbi:putative protein N(5)-glutamine methyltransferase [Rhodococcus coprophilus]|uniref:putative protein N(5)-glutamine methyltransferase n=1 Tax=Rhodococcus coprophilus TaxID=38310 RepID=UPI0033ED2F00